MHYEAEEKESIYETINDLVENFEQMIPKLLKEKAVLEGELK